MEKGLIPAPIDNKNVTTDWIEEIFDFQTCVWNKKTAVGFIDNEPVIVSWENNILLWSFPLMLSVSDSDHLKVLKGRLEVYNDVNVELTTKDTAFGNVFMQKFYWKDNN